MTGRYIETCGGGLHHPGAVQWTHATLWNTEGSPDRIRASRLAPWISRRISHASYQRATARPGVGVILSESEHASMQDFQGAVMDSLWVLTELSLKQCLRRPYPLAA